jgi:hypothetical protein
MSEERHRTEELKIEQGSRETEERRLAESETSEQGTAQHARRADKHAYLKEKLAEREESERRAESEDG